MAYSSVESAMTTIQTAVAAVTGIKFAPSYPPEVPNDFPFAVTYPTGGRMLQEPQGMFTIWVDMVVEIHVARVDLPSDIDEVLGYAASVPNAVYGNLNSNNSGHGTSSFTFGALGWGFGDDTPQTIGFRWTFTEVKIQVALS